MSEEAKPQRLTAQDPVGADTLKEFNKLEEARHEVALRLLEIEQERVRLLAAAHQVDQQHRRMFEKVLVDRGIDPSTGIDIDAKTGQIKIRTPQAAPAQG